MIQQIVTQKFTDDMVLTPSYLIKETQQTKAF